MYSIEDHKHRLAAWDAATSARASPLCRFKVELGMRILEAAGFGPDFSCVEQLPQLTKTDAAHEEWRINVIKKAKVHGLEFTHGVAAKLINCYLKARFVCGGHHGDPRVAGLHPPIDAVLLDALAKQNVGGQGRVWKGFHKACWSKFDSDTYQAVIECIRDSLDEGEPLWMIEQYWKGHQ